MVRWLSLSLLLVAGCAQSRVSVIEAFPPAAYAAPWVLKDQVWSGTFDEAAIALGDDADDWRPFAPERVWLAKYCHTDRPRRCLTVRCFAVASPEQARRAYEALRPADAKPFGSGDVGCWTDIGVLFQWGCLVIDVFGPDASWNSELESALLAGFITQRMPPGAPERPQ